MAFDFPNPPTAEPVTNPETGVTYQYDAASDTWVVVSSAAAETLGDTIDDLKSDVSNNTQSIGNLTITVGLQGSRISALENAPDTGGGITDVQLSSQYNQESVHIKVNGDADDGTELRAATHYTAGVMGITEFRKLETWDEVNYYNKADIDQKFLDLETVKGGSGTYQLKDVGMTVASRPGDMYIDNAIAKNITFISVADIDANGNPRPVGTPGDQLELVSAFGYSYRYNIVDAADGTSTVEYVTGHDGDDLFFNGTNFTLYVYPVQVGDYYTKAESDSRYVQKVDDGFDLQGDDLKYFIESRRPATIMMDVTDTAAWVGEAQPVGDPQGRIGWHFENNGNKIQWTLWAQELNAQEQFTIGDLKSCNIVVRNSGVRYPFINIYTRRKNDGQDASATYRSRYTYESLADGTGLVKATFLTNRQNNPLYSNLPHIIMSKQNAYQSRLSIGPQEDDEVIKTVVIGTDSGASPGDYKFTIEQLVIDTSSELFVTELVAADHPDPDAARMYYQDNAPNALGRKNGDLWFDSDTMRLLVWHQNAWVNPDREGE